MKTDPPTPAKITWDEKGQPTSTRFDDIYFSREDGIAESHYVFLKGNQLPSRWETLATNECFTIGETGFGTGLNFLITWHLWQTSKAQPSNRLHFISTELYPLSREQLTQACHAWPEYQTLSQQLIDAYPPQPISGIHRLIFDDVTLTLCFDEATTSFEQLAPITEAGPNVKSHQQTLADNVKYVDAWYLDGFAPSKNPDMWTPSLFRALANISKTNCTFATFTAASLVRKNLLAEGFQPEKIKGFGRKREMLIGQYSPNTERKNGIETTDSLRQESPTPDHFRDHQKQKIHAEPSWHLIEKPHTKAAKHCVVIGGGVAGCHTAYALAKKGIQVTLLEKGPQLAQEASGNHQGVVYAKLSLAPSPINTFNISALIFATHFYQKNNFFKNSGNACGVLQIATTPSLKKQYQAFAQEFNGEQQFVEWLDSQTRLPTTGRKIQHEGLLLTNSGWLSPPLLCQHLVDHHNISVLTNTEATQLKYDESEWQISIRGSNTLSADNIVLANAAAASRFEQSQHLPLKQIRGQVSYLPETDMSESLAYVLCGDGYIAPAFQGKHSLGATFTLHNSTPALLPEDSAENLAKLKALSPTLASSAPSAGALAGKVGFRCTTPDYFPIVGPAPDFVAMEERFGFLRKKANAVIDTPGAHFPGLYTLLGLGARGLTYAPLAAELVASLISRAPLPVSRELYRYLHPGRFIIRDLMRNKI